MPVHELTTGTHKDKQIERWVSCTFRDLQYVFSKTETANNRYEFLEKKSKLLEKKAACEATAISQKAKLDAAEKRLSAKNVAQL